MIDATMPKTYVIGDVHGMLDTLSELLNKLPLDAKVVFVGDLIDRGDKSAQVISLVRKKGYACVLGNHENTFIRFFKDYFNGMDFDTLMEKWTMWLFANGGKETLQSYDFWDKSNSREAVLKKIKSDMEWMQQLPVYLKLNAKHPSNLPVVVSHSNITQVWHLRDNKEAFKTFKDKTTRTRNLTCKNCGILNIYGHTPKPIGTKDKHCINVDTGCCYTQEGYGKLTAYCVEDDKFISVCKK